MLSLRGLYLIKIIKKIYIYKTDAERSVIISDNTLDGPARPSKPRLGAATRSPVNINIARDNNPNFVFRRVHYCGVVTIFLTITFFLWKISTTNKSSIVRLLGNTSLKKKNSLPVTPYHPPHAKSGPQKTHLPHQKNSGQKTMSAMRTRPIPLHRGMTPPHQEF